jgi:hypothetical protein
LIQPRKAIFFKPENQCAGYMLAITVDNILVLNKYDSNKIKNEMESNYTYKKSKN